jgi:1-phosphofructokinase family hexose kinase
LIFCLCANAGVDRTYEVPDFAVGGFHHPARMLVGAGGKGVNVARGLSALRVPVAVAGFAGGRAGALLAADLRRLGIQPALTQIREESRTTLTVVDPQTHSVTRLDEWGPLVSPTEVLMLRGQWKAAMQSAEFAVIAGNPPRGVPRELYAQLVSRSVKEGVPTLVDAHEEHLQGALSARPQVVKVNLRELTWLAKRPLVVPDGVIAFSVELLAEGVEAVFTTLGAAGALLVARGLNPALVTAPEVDAVSAVGCGDAATAGWVAAHREGRPLTERARWAVAAGSANCALLPAAAITREALENLLPQVIVEPL